MSSTKVIGSIYIQLGLGVLLTGTMLIASGCNTNTAAPNLNQKLYATNGDSVVVFTPPANTTVNVAPTFNITGALTGLIDPHRIAIDAKGNIYVTNHGNSTVSVFAAGATGNVAPTATISGAGTGLSGPSGIALDSAGKIYVANSESNSITVYAAGATGNATPAVTIYGTNTGLSFPNGLALDSTGKIYVSNEDGNSITVYAANPTYVPASSINPNVNLAPTELINVLNEAPTVTISGTNTGLSCPHALALDATGNIYAVNAGCDTGNSVTVYAASATGNATPTATISGKSTNFDNPNGIALDAEGDIYVGNQNSVEVYAAKPTGSVTTAPVYTLTGTTTGLNGIHGITVY
jgi:sugar lactone lactonase YvrE